MTSLTSVGHEVKEICLFVPSSFVVDEILFSNVHVTSQILELGIQHYKLIQESKDVITHRPEYRELLSTHERLQQDMKEKQERITILSQQVQQVEQEMNEKHNLRIEMEVAKLKNTHHEEINGMKKQVEELKKINEHCYSDYHVKLQSVITVFTEEKERIKDQSRQEGERMRQFMESMYHDKIQSLLVYKERWEGNEQRIIDLQRRNEELLERASFLSKSSNKGKEGECFVQSLLTEKFKLGKCFDMTNEPHHGDFHLHLTHAKILIESKNVERLQKVRDLDKFVKDIQSCANGNKINAGLFLCMNDIVIKDGTKHFVFEFIDHVPVIYLSNVINNVEVVSMSIIILENIVSSLNCYQQSSEEFEDTRRHIIDTVKIIMSNLDVLQQDLCLDEQDVTNLMNRIQRKKDNMKIINMKILELISNESSLSHLPLSNHHTQQEQEEEYEHYLIDKIRARYSPGEEIPKCSIKQLQELFPQDVNLIKKMGIKKINEQLKKHNNNTTSTSPVDNGSFTSSTLLL